MLLFDLTFELAQRLGVIRTSYADAGGTATSLVDATILSKDDTYKNGAIWVLWDAGDADAAPENEFAEITSWTLSTNTFAHSTLTAATAAGDRYAYTNGNFPLPVLINAINNEIVKYRIEKWDLTSLDVVLDQSEYNLPTGIYKHNLLNVFETTLDDDNNNRPVPLNFFVQQTATGSVDILHIDSRVVGVGNDIFLQYWAQHDRVYDADDVIDDSISKELILASAAYNVLRNRMMTYGSESKLEIDMLKSLKESMDDAERRFRPRYSKRRGNVNEAGSSNRGLSSDWISAPR